MADIQHFPLMIAGLDKKGDHTLEVKSPFNDQIIGTAEQSDEKAIEHALTTASRLFTDRRNWLPIPVRLAILERAIHIMEARAEELAADSANEGGKPLIDSRIEMTRCIDSIRLCVDSLRSESPKPVPMGINPASQHRLTVIKKEPIGMSLLPLVHLTTL